MDTLQYILDKFKPVLAIRGGSEIWGINRTIMAKTLGELGFKVGAEIGVAEGYHAVVMCQQNRNMMLFGIDIWEKYSGYSEYEDPDQCYVDARRSLSSYSCKIIRKYSMDAVKNFDDNSLDFVYIDGAHDFRNVADDICEWSKKVRPGGIVFGHDYKRSTNKSKHKLYVKDVVDAYMYSHDISPWFILKNDLKDERFGHDNPGWMYIKGDK